MCGGPWGAVGPGRRRVGVGGVAERVRVAAVLGRQVAVPGPVHRGRADGAGELGQAVAVPGVAVMPATGVPRSAGAAAGHALAGHVLARGVRRGSIVRRRHTTRGRRRVYRHRELDAAAELPGQRVGDEPAKTGLELLLDELVGGGDEGGVLDQAEWSGQPQPSTLMRLDLEIGELLQGPRPHLRKVCLAHWVFTSRPHMRINSLIHRLCTPHSAPCPGRRWTALAGPRHPVPRGLAGYPQPKLAGRIAFGKPLFLPTVMMRPSGCRGCPGLTGA